MNIIRKFSTAAVLTTLVLLHGCFSSWPPDSPAKAPIADFKITTSHKFNDWTHVFANEKDAKAKHDPLGMAYLLKEGNFELPFNLFTIKAPDATYVASQFEVLYFGKNKTQIRVVKDKGDRVALIQGKMSNDLGMTFSYGFTHPGAKVRCADKIYELHADGWYQDGKLVHAFKH